MSKYNYSRYKILIDPQSKNTQGLQVGDVVRRQYYDAPNLIYSLMVVLETGVDIIGDGESPYFIGALLEGDEPRTGELLDFVRTTNLFNTDRSGALYLTASDSGAPFMDVIDGMAVENSLCYPFMAGGTADTPDRDRYACTADRLVNRAYEDEAEGASRVFRLTRNDAPRTPAERLAVKQSIERRVANPQRLLISYKIRASQPMAGVPASFGYTNGAEIDAQEQIDIQDHWTYRLFLVTVDYPAQYQRSFVIDLTDHLTSAGQWVEVADLNIVLQSDISTFAKATKARVGKIKGVIDPVFGVLEGYGAYFQNLYATKNVNIAGTLTAGDENGFSSTFYVGKIHKNVITNSIDSQFADPFSVVTPAAAPAGIGNVWLLGAYAKLYVQSREWRTAHIGKVYCFSIWIKSEQDVVLSVYQDEHFVRDIQVKGSDSWTRHYAPIVIRESNATDLCIRFDCTCTGIMASSPQLESGTSPSQYQATDGTLSYVEDYGAWFNKGGIGGTIQNPLLRLDEDGSIRSRDGSFVINPDGTGHFASGRFRWTKDTITLQDVTIRWEELSEEAQQEMKAKMVRLTGGDVFRYADELDPVCEPTQITVFAQELNFTAEDRRWQYLDSAGVWKTLAGQIQDYLHILPAGHYWEERSILSVKYIATCKEVAYEDIFTVSKLFDGQDSYSLYIDSSNGTVFRSGVITTTLRVYVYKGGKDVTDRFPPERFLWSRTSKDAASDELWNSSVHYGRTLELTGEDVFQKAVFDCELIISNQ